MLIGLMRYWESGKFLLSASISLVKWEVRSLIETGSEKEGDGGLKKGEKV